MDPTSEAGRKAIEVFGRRALREIVNEAAVAWAIDTLSAGADSPNLRILAGLQAPLYWSEVEQYFEQATRELGIPQPQSEAAALRSYALMVTGGLLSGEVGPKDGVRVLRKIYDSGLEDSLSQFMCLDVALTDMAEGAPPYAYPELRPDNLGSLCRKEAQTYLKKVVG